MISNIYPLGRERPVFQTQIPLNPGSSGGPVVERLGRVIGVVSAGIEGSNSINFAIRSEVALTAFPFLPRSSEGLVITAPAGVPVFLDGKMAGTGPRVVVAAKEGRHKVFAVINGKMTQQVIDYPTQREVSLK